MSGTALKLIALVLMLIDHIAQFIPGMPVWYHYLGRISAPLFMFCLAEGFAHTSDKVKYLKRLYIGSLAMGIIDMASAILVRNAAQPLTNNILSTWFLTGLIITIYEKKKNKEKDANRLLIYAVISQVVSVILCFIVEAVAAAYAAEVGSGTLTAVIRENSVHFINGLIPNILFCEGGYLIIVFGFMMYYYRDKRKMMPIVYVYMCLVYAFILFFTGGRNIRALLDNYQWMMILATPFFYLYNGKKGLGLKYLFYFFYPVHLVILFFVGNLLF